jgi:hypothetical protein
MTTPGMLYTFGYGRSKQARLVELAEELDAKVVDCRSSPHTRVAGFGKRQLTEALGSRYVWKGAILGGRNDGPTPEGLAWIRAELSLGHNLIAMCMEHAPGDCHRHCWIGLPLAKEGVTVRHVFENTLIEPVELQRAKDIGPDTEYDCEIVEKWFQYVTA